MGGKKKSMANRLAKMSDEERQRYMQHKADQEEEVRRRKEQLVNIFLKKKIKHEDAFARLNIAKLNENWHQLLRKIKCKEMREEVNHMKEHVDRVLAFKNRIIKKLLEELVEAEEQYNNNFQSHLNYINKTIEFGSKALDDMHEEFDEQVIVLIREVGIERKHIFQAAYEQELHLKTLLFQFDTKTKTELRDNYDYYFKISDDVIQKNKKEFEEMRHAKETQITKLWFQIGKYLKEYVEKTDTKRAHLAELNTLDTQNAQEIENNEKDLVNKQVQLEKLEKHFKKLQVEGNKETQQMQEFVKTLKGHFLKHKLTTHKNLQDDEKNQQYLTTTSNTALEYLEAQHNKAENLLKLSLICRKYETEEESATRFITFTQVDNEFWLPLQDPSDDDEDALPSPPLSPTDGSLHEAYTRVKKMDHFWHYYNKVLIKLMSMKKQKADLQEKNRGLQEQIRDAMETRVDRLLDRKLEENARMVERNLYVVCTSATSVKTNNKLCLT